MRIAHSHSTSDIANNTRIGKAYQSFSKLIISKFATHFIACGKDASNFLFPNNKDVMLLPNAILFDSFIKPIDKNPNNVFNTNNISDKTIIISQIGRLTLLKNHTFTSWSPAASNQTSNFNQSRTYKRDEKLTWTYKAGAETVHTRIPA